jgi:hypothetical protein
LPSGLEKKPTLLWVFPGHHMTLDALEYPRAFQSNSRQPGYKGNFPDDGYAYSFQSWGTLDCTKGCIFINAVANKNECHIKVLSGQLCSLIKPSAKKSKKRKTVYHF